MRRLVPMYGSTGPEEPGRRLGGVGGRLRGGLRHQYVVVLTLFTLAFLSGLLDTTVGWLAIGLVWAVLGFLSRRRAEGWREWVKGLAEYVTVGALVFALMTAAAPTAPPPKAKPKAKPKPKAEATQADPWIDLGAELGKLRDRLPKDLPRVEFTSQEGR